MRLLELFSGTKSVGRAFEALGWEVTSLDADATTRPSICADIREWDYRTYPPGHFDLIWASPVCTEFSRALTRRPRRLEDGDRLVLKTIEIIGYLRPRWWAVENPRTGLLKSRPYILHASAALQRRVLLHVRLSLPEDHPHLEQPALGSQPTSLFQARTLRSLPRRPAPRNGPEAGQPALAWPDPGAVVLPATPAVPGDRGEPKWER